MRYSSFTQQQGIGLIEVMVALLVLAIAVLGYSALQAQAIKTTDESLERTQSLVMMRNIAEKIRSNPTVIKVYGDRLKASSVSEPANKCGLDGSAVTALCDPTQLANADTYFFRQEIAAYGFEVQMHPCPGTGAKNEDNIMFSYCLLAAWGDTKPTIGADGDVDCLKDTGIYHSKATCMMMEL